MKKILVIAVLFVFASSAHSQSLSAKDLVNLLDKSDENTYLKARSFTLSGRNSKDHTDSFVKNPGTTTQESIMVSETSVLYMTRSNVYINALLAQLQRQYQLVSKDDDQDFVYYQFKAGNRYVSINLPTGKDNHYSLEVLENKD